MDKRTRAGEPLRAHLGLVAIALIAGGCLALEQDPQPTGSAGTPSPDASELATASPGPATPIPRATSHTYRIRRGDTLYTIAQRFGLTIGQLLAANPAITNPDLITVGQVIVIPPPDAPDTGPNSAGIGDTRDDVADPDGVPIIGQSYDDITGVGADLQGNRLFVEILLLRAPPARVNPASEVITYTVVIDVDGDGQPDYRLIYGNDVEGQNGFAASFEDRDSGEIRSAGRFPGDLEVTERAIRFRVNRGALGNPRGYALAVKAERWFYPGGRDDPEVEAGIDYAPDQQWPRPNARWIELGGV